MKTILLCLMLLLIYTSAQARPTTTVLGTTSISATIPAAGFDLHFNISWASDRDNAAASAPGRIELRNSDGQVVGQVIAGIRRDTGVEISVTAGTISDLGTWALYFAEDGMVSTGELDATWHIRGLPAGVYTFRFYRYQTYTGTADSATVFTFSTWFTGAPAVSTAPSIAWTSSPGSVGNSQTYNISAHGHDDDGNLAQVNIWKDGQPFAFAGEGDGTDGDSSNSSTDAGPRTITYTAQAVDATGMTSPVISQTVTVDGPANVPPTVSLISPNAQTVTTGTAVTIMARATDPDANISAHNLDIQRPAGDWNFQGGFATGEPFQGGPAGSGGDSTRSTSFTFSDVGTYYVRSAASDGSGWYHSATVAITVVPPPPTQYTLTTSAGSGGMVTPGGTYTAASTVVITATPDSVHDFTGWGGDAGGTANPLTVLIDRAKTVQATFAPKSFTLITNASSGGSVTPGGNYPYGTTVTIAAASDATHRFVGWSGDAGGAAPSIALTINRPLAVQALFEPKSVQTISFPPIGDQSVGASISLAVTSSSNLPVVLTVTGPASYANGVLTLTGPGAVNVQAAQAGDGYYLPAAPVVRTFNAAASAVVRYRVNARTVLQTGRTPESVHYVIQTNP